MAIVAGGEVICYFFLSDMLNAVNLKRSTTNDVNGILIAEKLLGFCESNMTC